MGKQKHSGEEYNEDYNVETKTDYKHLTEGCDCKFVQEGESGLHCPKCGCWPEIHNKGEVS